MIKKYTYEDWFNGNVVLQYSRIVFDKKIQEEPSVVSWDNFEEIEKAKIEKKQESIFKDLLKQLTEKTTSDFIIKCESSMFPEIFIDREFESLSALWNNKYLRNAGICYSPIDQDSRTFDESYYQEMITHKIECFINGIKSKYDAVPSPNSKYHNSGLVLPEIMITTVYQMIRFIKRYKAKNPQPSSTQKKEAQPSSTVQKPEARTEPTNSQSNNPHSRFFDGDDAYQFFLDCKKELKVRNTNKKKNNESTLSEVAKYSLIFNFMKTRSLIFSDTKHLPFIEYLRKHHNAKIPKNCTKFPYQPSANDLDKLKILYDHNRWYKKFNLSEGNNYYSQKDIIVIPKRI